MGNDVVLSAGVRQNLLALQNTALLMASTQTRLATGKKVNSALDNPVNFFTSAGLSSRAKDLSALIDGMSNGIKTIETADHGITGIKSTIESMKSTLLQARQDKSFKSTAYTLNTAAIGTSVARNLTFSGGAVGATPVNISLNTVATVPAVQSTVAASAAYVPPTAATASTITTTNVFTDINLNANADNTYTFDVTLGASTANISLAQADGGVGNIIDIDEAIIAIQADLDAQSVAVTVGKDLAGTRLTFTADTAGATALTVDNVAVAGTGATASVNDLGITNPATTGETNTGAAAVDHVISISNGTATANITLTSANAADATTARAYITAQLAAQTVPGITVGGTGNNIDLAGLADGTNSITVAGAGADAVFGAARVVTPGAAGSGDGAVQTVDQLVAAINAHASLMDRVTASNDSGTLRITNLSTTDLDVVGITSGAVDGSLSATIIGGNTVRRNLVRQYNDLRDQLNKIADDASFNGVNLLRGDRLKINFNEFGTSTIVIQAKDEFGVPRPINTLTLGIDFLLNADVDNDTTIDTFLDSLNAGLNILRSQASSFGSNLSIVQIRTEFTNQLVNTLEIGADNLVLADTNEEGANMLALQTRQQLSTTALSLASQADQAVLRLFG